MLLCVFLFLAASHICTEPDRLSIIETFSTWNGASGHAFSRAVDFSNQNWHTLTFWTTAPPPKKKNKGGGWVVVIIEISTLMKVFQFALRIIWPYNGRLNEPAWLKGVLGSSKWCQWLKGSGSLGWMTYPLLMTRMHEVSTQGRRHKWIISPVEKKRCEKKTWLKSETTSHYCWWTKRGQRVAMVNGNKLHYVNDIFTYSILNCCLPGLISNWCLLLFLRTSTINRKTSDVYVFNGRPRVPLHSRTSPCSAWLSSLPPSPQRPRNLRFPNGQCFGFWGAIKSTTGVKYCLSGIINPP